MPSPHADRDLVASAASGQQDALAELYDRYSRYVYGVAVRVLGPGPAAEDVVQEVFLRVWRHAHRFDAERASLGTWLLHMTRNAAVDVLRSLRHRVPATDDQRLHAMADTGPSVESQVETHVFGEQVREVLLRLPPEQRLALELAFFSGLSHQEIADETHQPLGTVKSRIRLALEHLRAALMAARRKGVRQGGH